MSEMATEQPKVLIVDDSKVIRLGAKKMLNDRYELLFAEDGEIAWQMIQKTPSIAVVLTDLNMPNMDGMTLLNCIRGSSETAIANLPVIILSGSEDDSLVKENAMNAGANDFVFKPFDSLELNSRVKSYVNFSQKVAILEEKSVYDALTGLFNNAAFNAHGEKAISFAHRHHASAGICVIAINFLQQYELQYGKKVAQIIFLTVVKKIKKILREEDVAARLDGSKIALFLPSSDEKKSRVVLDRLQKNVQQLIFEVGEKKLQLVVNIGFTVLKPGEKQSFEVLLNQAQDVLNSLECTEHGQLVYRGTYQISTDVTPSVSVETKSEAALEVRTASGLERALQHIVNGDFNKIDEKDRQCVADQLMLFMRFAETHQAESL